MSSVNQFLKGLLVPMHGFFIVITSFQLFFLAIIPFWIAVFAAIYIAVTFWSRSSELLPLILHWVPGFAHFVDQIKIGEFSLFAALFQGLFWVFLVLFSLYFSYIVLCILGAPFYSLMVDRILFKKGIQPQIKNNFFRWLYTSLKMLIISFIKLLFFLVITALLFVVSFWSFGVMLVPLVVCLMIAYDCVDFSLECMNYSLTARWKYFRDHFALFSGLALSILLFSFIPGLFTLSLPFFIAGAAEAFAYLAKTEVV
jgi:hypothetical protein